MRGLTRFCEESQICLKKWCILSITVVTRWDDFGYKLPLCTAFGKAQNIPLAPSYIIGCRTFT
jgi:hypothetical protein